MLKNALILGLSPFFLMSVAAQTNGKFEEIRDEYSRLPFSKDSYRIYKKVNAEHELVENNIHHTEFNQLGYYTPGLGYYFGGHGMYVNPEHVTKDLLSEDARFLPQYVMYNIVKIYHDENHQKIGNIRYLDNANIYLDKRWDSVSSKFIVKKDRDASEIKIGELFMVPSDKKYNVVSSSKTSCQLSRGGLLEVKSLVGDKAVVAYTTPQTTKSNKSYKRRVTCDLAKTYEIKTEVLAKLNFQFLKEARRYYKGHQIAINRNFPGKRFVELNLKDKVTFCSGSPEGMYSKIANDVKKREGAGDEFRVLNTGGSLDNLLNLREGVCNQALAQGDAIKQVEEQYDIKFNKSAQSVFNEYGFLICSNRVSAQDQSDLTSNNTIYLSSRRSGSFLTFNNLKKSISKKVKIKFADNANTLKALLDKDQTGNCHFTVTTPDSDIIKYVSALKTLKLVPIKLDSKEYKKSIIAGKRISRNKNYETISVDTYMIDEVSKNIKNELIQEKESTLIMDKNITTLCLGEKGSSSFKKGQMIARDLKNVLNLDTAKISNPSQCDITLKAATANVLENENILVESNQKIGAMLLCKGSQYIQGPVDLLVGYRINLLDNSIYDKELWNEIQPQLLNIERSLNESKARYIGYKKMYQENLKSYNALLANGNRDREQIEESFAKLEHSKRKALFFRREISLNNKGQSEITHSVNKYELLSSLATGNRSCFFKGVQLDKDGKTEGVFGKIMTPVSQLKVIDITKELHDVKSESIVDTRLDVLNKRVSIPVYQSVITKRDGVTVDSDLMNKIEFNFSKN